MGQRHHADLHLHDQRLSHLYNCLKLFKDQWQFGYVIHLQKRINLKHKSICYRKQCISQAGSQVSWENTFSKCKIILMNTFKFTFQLLFSQIYKNSSPLYQTYLEKADLMGDEDALFLWVIQCVNTHCTKHSFTMILQRNHYEWTLTILKQKHNDRNAN